MSDLLPVLDQKDTAAVKKAEQYLRTLTTGWKHDIALLTFCKFVQFFINALQLICIANLLADIVLHPAANHFIYHAVWIVLFLMLIKITMVVIVSHLNAHFTARILVYARKTLLTETENHLSGSEQIRVSGEITSVFAEKTEALVPYFTRYLPQLLLAVLVPVAIIGYIFTLNWICGAIMLTTIPIIPVYMILIGKGTATASRDQWYILAKMGGYFNDRLKGLSTLSVYGQLENEAARVKQASENYGQRAMKVLRIAFLNSAVLEFFSTIIIAGIAIFIGLSLLHYLNWGSITDFTLSRSLIILMLVPEFLLMLKTLGTFYHDRSTALGAILHLQEDGFFPLPAVADPESETISSFPPAACIPLVPPHIQLNALAFAYPEKKLLFQNLDLAIPPASKIQLKGANGAGKSSLIALLMRFSAPSSGTISLDGRYASDISVADYSRFFGWVGQHPRIFKGSLRSNLLMASTVADADILALIDAYFGTPAFFGAFPQGLDTPIADDGKSVSGGERQKIALMRVVLKNAPVLLLDEPFTHLDLKSAEQFMSALRQHATQKTIILVTHDNTLNFKDFKTFHLNAYLA